MPELTAATVNRRSTDLVLTWEVDGDLEDADLSPWLLSTHLIGGEDGPSHQFGFRHRDGKIEHVFFFDFVANMNYHTPQVQPQRTGNRWTAVFPVSEHVALAGTYNAALSFNESDNSNESSVSGTF